MNYYEILGVSQDSSHEVIRKAYHDMALRYHPDMHAGKAPLEVEQAQHSFIVISEAWQILRDPESRRRYDLSLNRWEYIAVNHDEHPETGRRTGKGHQLLSRTFGVLLLVVTFPVWMVTVIKTSVSFRRSDRYTF